MIIEKTTLMNVLESIKPGLAKKGIIEQFTHFVFTGEEVVTYNDEICISHPLKTDFTCSVPAVKLYKTLSGIQGNASVTLKLEEDKFLILTATTKASFNTTVEKDAEERIKMLGLDQIQEWGRLPEEFIKGMFLCMFSASKDMTKGVATCVYWKNNCLISSDGIRISKYDLGIETGMNVFIPARSVIELINFDNMNSFRVGENWAHFKTDDEVVFSTRIMDGEYPEVESFFKDEGTRIRLPEDLRAEIGSMMFMTEGMVDFDKKMRIRIEPGKIFCRMEDANDWIEKELETSYKQDPIELDINPLFLAQVMEKSTTVRIGERATFSRENFKHMLSLPEMK
jgi:DNA polymerase III sliding clamp (beta) subunit (PCNA family)